MKAYETFFQCDMIKYFYYTVLFLITVYGIFLRVRDFNTTDLWEDELWRAQQVYHAGSYGELIRGQYLGTESAVQFSEYLFGKTGMTLFGHTELAFRWSSLFFSCCSLLLLVGAASQLGLHKISTIFLLYVFSISRGFIEHAQEYKPYSFDSFCALVTLVLFLRAKKKGFQDPGELLAFFCLYSFLSNTSVFFCFLIPYLLIRVWTSFPATRKQVISWSLLIGITLMLSYVPQIRLLSERKVFSFWLLYCPTNWQSISYLITTWIPKTVDWYLFALPESTILNYTVTYVLLIISLVIGPVLFARAKNDIWMFIVFPFLIMFSLSLFEKYPLFTRVSTFYYPILMFSTIMVTEAAAKNLIPCSENPYWKTFTRASGFILALLLIWTIHVRLFYEPCCLNEKTEIKTLISSLEITASKNNKYYCNYPARLALAFYEPRLLNYFSESRDIPIGRRFAGFPKTTAKFTKSIEKIFAQNTQGLFWVFFVTGNKESNFLLRQLAEQHGYEIKKELTSSRSYLVALQKE